MGKTKGKKLWRKAIDTQEIDNALEESTLKQRQKTLVESVPDSQLFFVDKEQDASIAAAVEAGRPLARPKKAPKLLRCQAILNSAHAAKPVNPVVPRKKLKGPAVKPAKKRAAKKAVVPSSGEKDAELDLWEDRLSSDPAVRPATSRTKIKGVEIDMPGCSFNPEDEQHQDALAEAVAAEMTKVYASEHLPGRNLRFNHMPEPDELTALLGYDEEGEEEEGEGHEPADEAEQEAAEAKAGLKSVQKRKTQTDRNRAKRRRDAEDEHDAKQRLKKQRRDLDSLPELTKDLAQQEILAKARAIRKAVTKAEKALTEPPRLGKQKFQPANIQVLLSEEVDGSLRRLKAAPMLTKDRFKALQKQGLIEPRVHIEKATPRRRVTYQTGDRTEKIVAGHEETQKLMKSKAKTAPKPKTAKR